MKKALGLALAALFVAACQPRADRPGLEERDQQERQQQQEQSGQMGATAGERFTEVGTVTSASQDELTLRRQSGEEVSLDLTDTTAITMDGRFVQADALPEGAEVRASYTMDGENRVAESVEVLRAGQQQQQQQQQDQQQQERQQQQEQMEREQY